MLVVKERKNTAVSIAVVAGILVACGSVIALAYKRLHREVAESDFEY